LVLDPDNIPTVSGLGDELLTGDVQIIDTEIASQDTAIVLGMRAKITL
jgi:hypothetical protein